MNSHIRGSRAIIMKGETNCYCCPWFSVRNTFVGLFSIHSYLESLDVTEYKEVVYRNSAKQLLAIQNTMANLNLNLKSRPFVDNIVVEDVYVSSLIIKALTEIRREARSVSSKKVMKHLSFNQKLIVYFADNFSFNFFRTNQYFIRWQNTFAIGRLWLCLVVQQLWFLPTNYWKNRDFGQILFSITNKFQLHLRIVNAYIQSFKSNKNKEIIMT